MGNGARVSEAKHLPAGCIWKEHKGSRTDAVACRTMSTGSHQSLDQAGTGLVVAAGSQKGVPAAGWKWRGS